MNEAIIVDRDDLDNAVFSAATEVADKVPGLTVRQKMKFALETADSIMAAVDSITEAGKRSAAGRKAAEARHGKKVTPTPGPAIPVPVAPAAAALPPVPQTVIMPPPPTTPMPGNFLAPPDTAPSSNLPPPPHPALAPAPGATPAPFGG